MTPQMLLYNNYKAKEDPVHKIIPTAKIICTHFAFKAGYSLTTDDTKKIKRNSYIVFLKLLNGELGLHQVVVQDDDLAAQCTLLIIMVL